MGLSCGLVGLPSCGKTVIFNAVTAAGASTYSGAEVNRVVVNVPDHRLDKLAAMYHPRKVVPATLEVFDLPGLRASQDGRGSRLLASIKDVDAILHVVRCFEDADVPFVHNTIDPRRDVETIDIELMAADSGTLDNKITRLAKRVRVGDKDAIREVADTQKVHDAIQQGIPARKQNLTDKEKASVYECNLTSLKPVLYVANIKSVNDATNSHVTALETIAREEGGGVVAVCGKDEADISALEPAERAEFLRDLGLKESSMERLLAAAYRMLGLINFFTVGEDEVRAWTCHKGDKAPVAAGKIHSDMEKGFIRMEVMSYDDLISLGSEAAVAKAGKHRSEGRDYVVQDGDIVQVLFNKKG